MNGPAEYFHLRPGCALPGIAHLAPYRAVVVIEAETTAEWRTAVAGWLAETGCLYACTWGIDCQAWHDSIDQASYVMFGTTDVPDDGLIMTTWHENEPLAEAMFFLNHCARHPAVELQHTVVIHIADAGDASRLLAELAKE